MGTGKKGNFTDDEVNDGIKRIRRRKSDQKKSIKRIMKMEMERQKIKE